MLGWTAGDWPNGIGVEDDLGRQHWLGAARRHDDASGMLRSVQYSGRGYVVVVLSA